MKSLINKILDLGYDGTDVHYLMTYFGISGVVVLDPREPGEETMKTGIRIGKRKILKKIVEAGDKLIIDYFIAEGKYESKKQIDAS